MDHLGVLDARRVTHTLKWNLDRERKLWQPIVNKVTADEDISDKQRDETAVFLTRMAAEFRFLPETCGLAILLLDKVLKSVKVRPKYLQCVSVTCLYIAAKTLEEDENIPSTQDLVRRSRCGFSYSEITRMEMVILTKLEWNIKIPTAIDFLHMIHVVLLLRYPQLLSGQDCKGPSEHLMIAVRKLIRCLTSHSFLVFRPSTLALALISLELEQITPGWLRIVAALQRMTNVGSEQLMCCREQMACFLGQQLLTSSHTRPRIPSTSTPQSKKRKVEHISTIRDEEKEDNIYDGITLLFSEEPDINALRTSCSMEMHQDNEENLNSSGQTLLVS